MTITLQFSSELLKWYQQYGRKNLPWKVPKDPYRIWVSEIMLQQTQVQTVIAYFQRFIERLPTVYDLAQAPEDTILSLWSGLGYYSRARNLHRTAQIIVKHYEGQFPKELELLTQLPGIGPSTAAAILSQAFDLPTAILDANVKRVLARFFLIKGFPEQSQVKKTLWQYAQACMPQEHCAEYTQAIMDLGATCCTNKKPNCQECPVQKNCLAYKNEEQHLYPSKKIKKPVPTQQQQFLVLTNEKGAIYLEKRPPVGIWGGLWCLPALDLDHCPLAFILQNYELKGDAPKAITQFKHHFSHFHLEITALSIKTQSLSRQVADAKGAWFRKDELNELGLAKPTSVILDLV